MKEKIGSKSKIIYQTVDEFRNKAGAWQSQDKTSKLKTKLKYLLTEQEYWELSIAHSHYVIGEGATELYDICKKLMEKYNYGV
jgi:hypothetical protein